jgi:transcriptional regulator with XRE-family HTH domain
VDQHTSPNVGARLRELREGSKLSLRALARQSGLSVTAIARIEKGQASPSVSTLQQLATALGVPVVAFFQVESRPKSVVFVRANARSRIALPGGQLERLGSGLADQCIEPLLLTLEPRAGSGEEPITHLGHEFVLCLSGRLEYGVDEQVYLLNGGDSLLFEAHLPHRWRNPGPEQTTALLLLYSHQGHERPLRRHFRRVRAIQVGS